MTYIVALMPMSRFLGHQFTKAEVELVEEESRVQAVPVSTWTINLSVLWASPDITPCDMHKLSHVLADEIYNRVEASEQLAAAAAWQEEEEEEGMEEEEMGENEQAEFLLSEWADLEGEEYESSEESSNEEYDEEAITDIIFGKEEVIEYPFHMSDYDYLANVKGEYDELAVDKEVGGSAEDLYDTDDYYK